MDPLFLASFAGFCIVGATSVWALLMPPARAWRLPVFGLLAAILACQLSTVAATLPADPLRSKAWALCGCALWSSSAVLWLWLASSLAQSRPRVRGLFPGLGLAIALVAVVPWMLGLFDRAVRVAGGIDFDVSLLRWGSLGSASVLLVAAAWICARDARAGGPRPLLLLGLGTALASTILRAIDSSQSAAPPLLAVAAVLGTSAAYPLLSSSLRSRADAPALADPPAPAAPPRSSERAIAEMEERHRALVEHLPVGVATLDRDLCVVDANPALAELVGAPDVAALLGAPIRQAPLYEQLPDLHGVLVGPLEEERAVSFEAEWKSRWGRQVRARVLGRPLRNAEGAVSGVQLFVCDLSPEQRLREQLIQSQRMEAVGQLAGRIAHDFNNYLSVILGHAELLMLELPETHPLASNAAAISGAAQRSAMLTRRLLSLSRPHLHHPRRVDVNRLVSDLAPMLRSVLGNEIAVESELEPAVLTVYADPWELELALMNLTINARDAMPQGGTFCVSTREVELSPQEARSLAVQGGRYVVLAVTDTGHGMDADTRARIFEPFFTTKELGRGTGLGLSTVWGVAEQCRGFVNVESQMGQGSTFELFLPYAGEALGELSLPTRSERESLPN
jgi:PAS domain S-box-containing protein